MSAAHKINIGECMRDKMFIPFDSGLAGGPATFMYNLQRYLDAVHYPYTSLREAAHDGIFFPIEFAIDFLLSEKRVGRPIIQRLDGVYYPEKHGGAFLERNKIIKLIYQELADYLIFQSEYSKRQCFAMFGEKKPDRYSIVHNGTDLRVFHPSFFKRRPGRKVRFVTTGHFRNNDMIEPVVRALDLLVRRGFSFELLVAGPVTNETLRSHFARPYITMYGSLPLQQVAALLRRADIFIYSHLNPPCPNSVVEAVSAGVPVVGFDSGAMSELCFFNTELLAPVSANIFQRYSEFSFEKLAEKLELCIGDYAQYQKRALENADIYDFKRCGSRYVEAFAHVLGN